MANSRIQRWALTLSAYTVRYRPGVQNGKADACSRLPLQSTFADPPLEVELVLQMERVELGPVSVEDIGKATLHDSTLNRVSQLILEGWPENLNLDSNKDLSPYFKKRLELSVEDNVVLWGNRIVIPQVLRSKILQELHSTHQGVTGMKSIARSVLWWPNADSDIENMVRTCNVCIQNANMPAKSLQPWPAATRVWSRIHLDYAGPVDGNMILIVQDAYSKWIEGFSG